MKPLSSRGSGEWPGGAGSVRSQETLFSCQVPGLPSAAGAEQQTLVSQRAWESGLPVCAHVGFV